MNRTTPAILALFVGGLSFFGAAIGGCTKPGTNPSPRAGDEHVLNDASADRHDLPPLHTADPLPPAPVPATFDVADLAEKVQPTVVNITTLEKVSAPMMDHPFELFSGPEGMAPPQREGAGTGFIIDSNGYVVTNEHVVHDADEVRVKLSDEREYQADVIGRDSKLDIALLKLRDAHDLPAVHLGSSDKLRVGESVVAVGNPFGLGQTVTLGIVSAKQRRIDAGPYDDFIQTDAAINPGNSGGPLFNGRGEVVGINTAIRPGANTIGFAIPIDAVKDVLAPLRETGHVVRGKLGLVFQPLSPELAEALKLSSSNGALVAQVEQGGSASRAGIKPGDVIVSVNDTEIHHADELPRRVARNAPGASIKVVYLRDGKKIETKATLDTLEDDTGDEGPIKKTGAPTQNNNNKLGIQVGNAPGGGAVVDRISSSSPLKEVQPGDVIVELEGVPVKDVNSLQKALESAKPGSMVLAKIKRGDGTRFAPIPIPK
jgi:serine protease Do